MAKFNKLLLFSILFFSVIIFAQKKDLTFEQAYLLGTPKLTKSLPTVNTWEDENSYIIGEGQKLKIVNLLAKEERILLDYDELKSELPEGFSKLSSAIHTENYSKFILNKDNDVFLFERENNKLTQLTSDAEVEKNPTFSPNGNSIAYTKNHNLFVLNFSSGKEIQLTHDGSDVVYNGYASWIYYEEILGRGSKYRAFYWSPDSKHIVFMHFDDTNVPTFTLFNADGVHGELEVNHYPKPGDPIPDVKLGVVNVETQKTTWIDSTTNQGNYIAWPIFSYDSKGLLYQRMNRGQDELNLMLTNLDNPEPKELYKETHKTWVEFIDDIYLLQNEDGFLFISEADGWHHIYHYNLDGKLIKQITNGEWSVKDIARIDEERKIIFFHARKENSTEKHLYKISFSGNELEKLTEGEGTHSCTVIPNGQFFLDKWSSVKHPIKLVLYNLMDDENEIMADSKLPEMDEYNLAKVELFTIPTEDGYDLPAKWFLPPNFDEKKKYPIIFSIYGGPGNATVSNSFPRRGLGNYYLAQNGIIVIQVDNRGSGHFGKKGKDEMHRNLGVWEINDLVSAVKWLRKKSFVDSDKIAITGGSYGGYTTSMALARAGEYFKYGIAKYSVTDWRLYDNVYTERFMDTPEENPDGYNYGSVMTHAENYQGGMLITHGSLDDNVHMQNTIQLIDVLQNLDKEFELMIYPNQRHGIRYPKYPHSIKLDIDFWFKNLLGK
ncbi:MAG: S9 family peptidase [Melioribacteraceae bacterium]|jgi:dipeptidyl-peptidase-4|nr:S9 family peptidase [Melioribacteraceae bacterium]